MSMSDARLLELQVETLFTHDSAGRVVTTNEPGGRPAPRFFLGRSRESVLWRVRHDAPAPLAETLNALAGAEPLDQDLRAEPRGMAAYRDALRSDQEALSVIAGPAYRFPDTPPLVVRVTPITPITPTNLHLLLRMGWDSETLAAEVAARQPLMAIVEDSAAVSLCFCARSIARAAEAGVETLEAYRGRGYAPAVVLAWAQAIRASDRIPLYSTSWSNAASQAVARKLGLVQYAADLSLG
jgi:hypothetical protein